MARELGNGFTAWPDNAVELGTQRVIEMYAEGFAGAFFDPEESAGLNKEIVARGGAVDGGEIASRYGFAGDGAGKLTLLYPAVVKCFGLRALTKPGQKTGDCVSMMVRDLALMTICLEFLAGLPDEVSGKIEGLPSVSDLAISNGVFANEPFYKCRGHNGQGMSCSQAIRWVTTEGGIVLRKKYPEVDLESYNVPFEVGGRSGTPEWLEAIGREHPIRDVTRPKGYAAARDLMARGKATGVCSGLGFSSKRDQYGHARKSGGWAHSWHWAGCDDRPEAIEHFGQPQILAGHRWAAWNSGGRDIIASNNIVPASEQQAWIDLGLINPDTGNLLIPEGYWWFDANLANSCDIYSVSGASGWEGNTLPDYLGGFQ